MDYRELFNISSCGNLSLWFSESVTQQYPTLEGDSVVIMQEEQMKVLVVEDNSHNISNFVDMMK